MAQEKNNLKSRTKSKLEKRHTQTILPNKSAVIRLRARHADELVGEIVFNTGHEYSVATQRKTEQKTFLDKVVFVTPYSVDFHVSMLVLLKQKKTKEFLNARALFSRMCDEGRLSDRVACAAICAAQAEVDQVNAELINLGVAVESV